VPVPWTRWVLSFGVAAALLVGLVLFVNSHNTDSLATQSPAAAARANREAEIVVSQDQAPHVLKLRGGGSLHTAFVRAVRTDIAQRIERGTVPGPLNRVRCTAQGAGATARGFSCVATAAGVNYPYVGVADAGARRLVYCKRDVPPVPSQNIPVSRRCRI
jgi:hypothetical protein